MNGETPEQEIARLKREARLLANVLADIRAETWSADNGEVDLIRRLRKVAAILRPINDLVTLIRARP